jgi:hypothetical protein
MSNYLQQPASIVPVDWPCFCGGGSTCNCPPQEDITFFAEESGGFSQGGTLIYTPPATPEPSPIDPYRYDYTDGTLSISVRCFDGGYSVDVIYDGTEWEGSTTDITFCDMGIAAVYFTIRSTTDLVLAIGWTP